MSAPNDQFKPSARRPLSALLRHMIGFGALMLLSGCASLGYVSDNALGQWQVLSARQAISSVLEDPLTPEHLRERLILVQHALDFAERELGLPADGSYQQYADIKRPYVLWNIFATPELSLTPKPFCFAFFGCLGYRGFFDKPKAERFAAGLRADGLDVFVGGVAAYSTRGWFNDPVLNTMMGWSDAELIKTLYHELAHQRLYLKDETTFNESFAMAVAEQGLRAFAQEFDRELLDAREEHIDQQFISLILRYQEILRSLYESKASEADKRSEKQAIFIALKSDYDTLKDAWNGYSGYDKWMSNDLNNAKIASVSTYHTLIPFFEAILNSSARNFPLFLATVDKIIAADREPRDRCINEFLANVPLANGSCRVWLPAAHH
ncbi:MAG: aminopeptidase [Pseudomonadota bacterium]